MRRIGIVLVCLVVVPPVLALAVRLASGEVSPSARAGLLLAAVATLAFFTLVVLLAHVGPFRRRGHFAKETLGDLRQERRTVEDVLLHSDSLPAIRDRHVQGVESDEGVRSRSLGATLARAGQTVSVIHGVKDARIVASFATSEVRSVTVSEEARGLHRIHYATLRFSVDDVPTELSYALLRGPFLQPQNEKTLWRHLRDMWNLPMDQVAPTPR